MSVVRRRSPLELVHNADGKTGRRATNFADGGLAVGCSACEARLGLPRVHAELTILTTRGRRDKLTGQVVLDEFQIVCARCLKNGVTTRF